LFSFVFDPGLGHIPNGAARVGFLVSRDGYDFRAGRGEPLKFAQKQAAREIPRRMPGLIAAERGESRQMDRKTGQKCAEKG
jgi:hypothetical protein